MRGHTERAAATESFYVWRACFFFGLCVCELVCYAGSICAGVCVRWWEDESRVGDRNSAAARLEKKLISLLQLEPRRLGSLALTAHALALSPLQMASYRTQGANGPLDTTKARVFLASHVKKPSTSPPSKTHTVCSWSGMFGALEYLCSAGAKMFFHRIKCSKMPVKSMESTTTI